MSGPALTRSALLARIRVVLAFANDHLRVLQPADPVWSEPLDPYLTVCDKVLIETALLLVVVARVPRLPDALRVDLRTLARALSPRLRTERARALLMRHPRVAAPFGIGHLALEDAGEHDAEFDGLVRRAWASGHVEATERLPYRAMDVRWVRAALTGRGASYDDLLPHSILAACAHPIQMTVADTYALTHALMYVTDFGANPVPAGVATATVGEFVDAGLACHLLTENLDLTGELLMAAAMLDRLGSPYARAAWTALTAAWDRLRFLPSPTFVPTEFLAAGVAGPSYAFRHLYHTTYVAGMLCAIMLRRSGAPGGSSPPRGDRPDDGRLARECEHAVAAAQRFQRGVCGRGRSDSLEEALRPESVADCRPPSQADLQVLLLHAGRVGQCGGEQNVHDIGPLDATSFRVHELFAVLSDAVLIRAAQEYDLPTLAATLSLVSEVDTPVSLTAREAAAFILRQTLPVGAIGAQFVVPANLESPTAELVTRLLAESLGKFAARLRRVAPRDAKA